MKMKMKIALAASIAFASMVAPSMAHAGSDQVLLGRTILLEKESNAVIPMLICKRVDGIKVKAEKDTYISRVRVKFQNGDSKSINFMSTVRKGDETRWRKFDRTRCVKSLEVFGRPHKWKAGVKVYGRK